MRILKLALLALVLSTPAFADTLGSVTGGTAGTQSGMAGGVYLTSPQTLSDKQQAAFLLNNNHALVISCPDGTCAGGGGGGSVTIIGPLDPNGSVQDTLYDSGGTAVCTDTVDHACKVEVVNNGTLINTAATGMTYAPIGGLVNTSAPSGATDNTIRPPSLDANSNLRMTLMTALPAGSNAIGSVTLGAGTNLIGNVAPVAASTGGATPGLSANVTNAAQAVDASPGNIYWYFITNNNTSVCYLQIYNIAAASVTVGTSTPQYSIGIPASSSSGGGANAGMAVGLNFATAISVAATTTRANGTACSSGLDVNIAIK